MTVLPMESCRPLPPTRDPLYASRGDAAVSYVPGHDFAEIEFKVAGRRTECSAEDARNLLAALIAVFGAANNETPADTGR